MQEFIILKLDQLQLLGKYNIQSIPEGRILNEDTVSQLTALQADCDGSALPFSAGNAEGTITDLRNAAGRIATPSGTGCVVRAWYGISGYDYVDSDRFTITKTPHRFDTSPTGGTVAPAHDILIAWETNFTPLRVEFGTRVGTVGTFTSLKEITGQMTRSNHFYLPFVEVPGDAACVMRAWYGVGPYDYADSARFTIKKGDATITGLPASLTVPVGGTARLTWSVDCATTKCVLGYNTGKFTAVAEISGRAAGVSYTYDLSGKDALPLDTWCVKAYYENGSCSSDDFSVQPSVLLPVNVEALDQRPDESRSFSWSLPAGVVSSSVELWDNDFKSPELQKQLSRGATSAIPDWIGANDSYLCWVKVNATNGNTYYSRPIPVFCEEKHVEVENDESHFTVAAGEYVDVGIDVNFPHLRFEVWSRDPFGYYMHREVAELYSRLSPPGP